MTYTIYCSMIFEILFVSAAEDSKGNLKGFVLGTSQEKVYTEIKEMGFKPYGKVFCFKEGTKW